MLRSKRLQPQKSFRFLPFTFLGLSNCNLHYIRLLLRIVETRTEQDTETTDQTFPEYVHRGRLFVAYDYDWSNKYITVVLEVATKGHKTCVSQAKCNCLSTSEIGPHVLVCFRATACQPNFRLSCSLSMHCFPIITIQHYLIMTWSIIFNCQPFI